MSPIEIDGIEYYSQTQVLRDLRISRQTLYRWRQDGKIPVGHLYRGTRIIFTTEEVEAIRQYANRVEPLNPTNTNQLKLFNNKRFLTLMSSFNDLSTRITNDRQRLLIAFSIQRKRDALFCYRIAKPIGLYQRKMICIDINAACACGLHCRR